MGLAGSSLTARFFRVLRWGLRMKTRFALGTSTGIGTFISVDKKVNKMDRVGVNLKAATLGGVSFEMRFMRLGQRFVVPVLLTPRFDLRVAVVAVIVPALIAVGVETLWLESVRKLRREEEIATLKADNAEMLEKRKQDALNAVRLMTVQVARRVEAEEIKNGE